MSQNESERTVPGSLDAEYLTAALGAVGYSQVEVVDSIGSTNTELSQRITELPDYTVLCAHEQTAGRGRLGRQWMAPAGSQATASVVIKPEVSVDKLGWLPLLTGLAIATAVRSCGVQAELKWPNDVMVEGKKLCGILAEAGQMVPVPQVVVGFGINVGIRAQDLPVETATSFAAVGVDVPREKVLVEVLDEFYRLTQVWRAQGGDVRGLADKYKELSCTLGTVVRVHMPKGDYVVGTACDLTERGELVVEQEHGGKIVVSAGDVQHVRPAHAAGE